MRWGIKCFWEIQKCRFDKIVCVNTFTIKQYDSLKSNKASAAETTFRKSNWSGFINSIFCAWFDLCLCKIRLKFLKMHLWLILSCICCIHRVTFFVDRADFSFFNAIWKKSLFNVFIKNLSRMWYNYYWPSFIVQAGTVQGPNGLLELNSLTTSWTNFSLTN